MKSLARVIPTVVAHELKDMGQLVDIDSDQVQEEIVSVVDEVSAVLQVGLSTSARSVWIFFL